MLTGTAGSSLLLTLVWIVFTEVSSASRSGSGLAVGIWCIGIIYSSRADGAVATCDKRRREKPPYDLATLEVIVTKVTSNSNKIVTFGFGHLKQQRLLSWHQKQLLD